jgi:threonine dehydrogenase-like Zn-dependent dehydrogenase
VPGSGCHNLCVHIRFYSAGPDPGFFRDIVNLPEHNVLPLPAGLGFAEGTLLRPARYRPTQHAVRQADAR